MKSAANHENHICIDLSVIQICILAGIMGVRTVYGIDCKEAACSIHAQYDSVIQTVVEEMIAKSILSYSMDGIFHVQPDVMQIIETVCSPNAIFSYCQGGKDKRKLTLLEKDGVIIRAEHLHNKNLVRFTYQDRLCAKDLLGSMLFITGGFQTEIYSPDLTFANKCIREFNVTAAREHLKKCIDDDTICIALMSLLQQTGSYVSACAQYHTPYGYRDAGGIFIVSYTHGTVCVSADSNAFIRFSPISRKETESEIDWLLRVLYHKNAEEISDLS